MDRRDLLERAASGVNLTLHIGHVNMEQSTIDALHGMLGKVDSVLLFPDREVLDRRGIRSLLLRTFRDNVPVIGYSDSLVRAGALAAVYSSPDSLGTETAELLVQEIIALSPDRWPPPYHPEQFSIGVNRDVARSLRLSLPSDREIEARLRAGENTRVH
jgi:putative tryptophan/tyrosine transport system substrate-binding protein